MGAEYGGSEYSMILVLRICVISVLIRSYNEEATYIDALQSAFCHIE